MKNKNGFVVSAVLYPLLVLFLAIIMGLLSMTDTRKRILDRMKLEITDNIFDDASCSCDTILAKLNYIIANGVGGSSSGGGSYAYNVLGLNVKKYETPSSLPNIGNAIGDVAVITTSITESDKYKSFSYYVSNKVPKDPKEGQVWIVQDIKSEYKIESDYSSIGINYAMEYYNGEWTLRKTYVYTEKGWTLLYYVPVSNGEVDLTSSDINGKVKWEYSYTGEYQTFTAPYSGYYKVELWGAQGGSYGGTGGYGAYTKGEIYLENGTTFYIYVGQKGINGINNVTSPGGWNGGGASGNYSGSPSGSGGGATDIRLISTSNKTIWNEFESLKSRIMVAAGGGGANNYSSNQNGGAGGGLVGYSGTQAGSGTAYYSATGGNQSIGGIQAGTNLNNITGGFGIGANSHTYGGGGGAGYFGGGGGSSTSSRVYSAAGGSSYISGYIGCISVKEESTALNLKLTHDAFHYSGYFFKNMVMTANSNAGDGKATIQLLSIKVENNIENEDNSEIVYTFSQTFQKFIVPKSGKYKVELWGSQGGSYGGTGGNGAYTKGEINFNLGTVLYIYVGQRGNNGTVGILTPGGWNGGGSSGNTSDSPSGSGGGATDIRIDIGDGTYYDINSLKSRIMVAAGGGGANNYSSNQNGGAGGGLVGYSGTQAGGGTAYYSATGGTQIKGGTQGGSSSSNVTGKLGIGANSNSYGGGGGGGYYGGGGGSSTSSRVYSAAGGSSYISGHAGCIGLTSDGSPKVTSYSILSDSISYTGYNFTNTVMIDGNGYEWTTSRGSRIYMPTFDGTSTMTGNTGNGYAKITYLGE